MTKMFTVLFEPDGKRVTVPEDTSILKAAKKAGILLNSPCGGQGTCGGCKVRLIDGKVPHTLADQEFLSTKELEQGYRLACQTKVSSDMTVSIPQETRYFEQKILVEGVQFKVPIYPYIRRKHIHLKEPSLEDQRSDLDRICSDLKEENIYHVPLHLKRMLPKLIRDFKFDISAIIQDSTLSGIEPYDPDKKFLGVAVDIGTTTVVGTLIDFETGKELAVASRTNPQVIYGDDIISRINYSNEHAEGLEELHNLLTSCLNDIFIEATEKASVSLNDIYEIAIAGNTTMNHFMLKVYPYHLAQAPYVAGLRKGQNVDPRSVDLAINHSGNVYTLPNIAAFVGGDTVGVILAGAIHQSEKVKLAIDIGTNGEIILGNKEKILCCSTAAGPAFEGARIRYGMRASAGAIDRVSIEDGKLKYTTLKSSPARGICGTGLVEAVCELRRVGIIDETGMMKSANEVENLPSPIKKRLKHDKFGNNFILAYPGESLFKNTITITQKDVRELQLAKSAIYSGIQILLSEYGITMDDVDEVLLAGAFGNYIEREMAINIGLLPRIPLEKVRLIGNGASQGAKICLLCKQYRDVAEEISLNARYIELAGRADFQGEFMENMTYPQLLTQ